MRRNQIVILDPRSSDPTWADVSECVIIPVPEDWDDSKQSVGEVLKYARENNLVEYVQELPKT